MIPMIRMKILVSLTNLMILMVPSRLLGRPAQFVKRRLAPYFRGPSRGPKLANSY